MPERNFDWAREKLLEFRKVLEHHREVSRAFGLQKATRETYFESLEAATRLQTVAWPIIRDLVSEAEPPKSLRYSSSGSEHIEYVDRALGALDGAEELSANWPSEPTITIGTATIHQWVWEPAKELWEIGRYKEALHSAAVTVNARLQIKVGRSDLEFAPLARNAFSPDAPKDGARLRLDVPDEWGADARKDMQLGAASLGEAVFRLWRNLPAHKAYQITEPGATEALGAMSVFARMVDDATVVTADTRPA